jgi:hypothetical protein
MFLVGDGGGRMAEARASGKGFTAVRGGRRRRTDFQTRA